MVEDTLVGMTLEQKVATFLCDAGAADGSFMWQRAMRPEKAWKKYSVGGLIYFCEEYPVGRPVKRNASNTASLQPVSAVFGVDEEGAERLRGCGRLKAG